LGKHFGGCSGDRGQVRHQKVLEFEVCHRHLHPSAPERRLPVALQNRLTSIYSIGSYFGDLGDGIHKGDETDPRVAVIEVIPDEIRYWLASSFPVSVQEVASTVQGKVTVPGELRTITNEEVSTLEVILAGRIFC
jgi:hypothetical protein